MGLFDKDVSFMSVLTDKILPEPIIVDCTQSSRDELLRLEWLHTNSLGSFASGTAGGCNTRRYHGLLIAATNPPVGRISTLSTIMEKVTMDGKSYDLATNEFDSTFCPDATKWLVKFSNDVIPAFVYNINGIQITKQIILAEQVNAVCIRYSIHGGSAEIELNPFLALRDFHHLRTNDKCMSLEKIPSGLRVYERKSQTPGIFITSDSAKFTPKPQWWYKFHYRVELSRGQDSHENLYTPGYFKCRLKDGQSVKITASLDSTYKFDFDKSSEYRHKKTLHLCESLQDDADDFERKLAIASNAFIARRKSSAGVFLKTILAGYPWFSDWGRDTFIALPGLLLSTQRFDQARSVFQIFADSLSKGMIPNRFDDYSTKAHYNSIDASLWFIIAAERFLREHRDMEFWSNVLMPTTHKILTQYHKGTRFDIHADSDNLLYGGSPTTQLTWMDAALGDEIITPRHGKSVEVNALWYCAHKIMADRCKGIDDDLAQHYQNQAKLIEISFRNAFIIPNGKYLYDCINENGSDASIRPNQILAVSLFHSPLDQATRQNVLETVTKHLLTPYGLRTLSPNDPRYRKQYGGSWQSRDRAYHQGTVWAWLIGPYIEAYLSVKKDDPQVIQNANNLLTKLEQHMNCGCIGQISEIFDGSPPHHYRGCFAQAWSVAEILRAKQLIRKYKKNEI